MVMKFFNYTKGFGNSSVSDTKRRSATPKPTVNGDPDAKRRQLCGQMARIIQELLNLPELSDADRRILSICSAVAFLLSGGR